MGGPGGASRALRSVLNRSAIHRGRAGRPGKTLELPPGREAAPQVIGLVAMGADRFDLEAVLLDPLGQSGDRQAVLPSVRAHAEAGDYGASSRWTRSCIGQILPPPRRPGSAGLRRPRCPRRSATRLLRARTASRTNSGNGVGRMPQFRSSVREVDETGGLRSHGTTAKLPGCAYPLSLCRGRYLPRFRFGTGRPQLAGPSSPPFAAGCRASRARAPMPSALRPGTTAVEPRRAVTDGNAAACE